MKDVNKIILIGRLGRSPELRSTKNGLSVVHFPLATSHRVLAQDETAEIDSAQGAPAGKKDETQWHRIVVWGKLAEICHQYLGKGQAVFVEGTVRTRKYTGKDGSERVAFEVHAENISFLGGKRIGGEAATHAEGLAPLMEMAVSA
jgi:single-strand DNA-binding protein